MYSLRNTVHIMAPTKNTISAATDIHPTMDPFDYLGMILNSDGSITRKDDGVLSNITTSDPSLHPVVTDDITVNQSNKIWVRLYLHRKALDSTQLLPVIVYIHASGFVVGSAASPPFHNFCSIMAVDIPALIVSVEYRLAPEHRLPAAYHDCVEALHWIKTSPHKWLSKFGDLSNCYIMGGSAGGNIAYHLATFLRDIDLGKLKIKGLILSQPYFGGTKRTESELRLVHDKVLPLNVNDVMWDLALPVGSDRDHEYCNHMAEGESGSACDWIKKLGWRVLMKGCEGDPLVDRQMELVKKMNEKGVEVVSSFDEGDCHGIEIFDPSKGKALCLVVRDFVSPSPSPKL